MALAGNGGSLLIGPDLLADRLGRGAAVTVTVTRAGGLDVPALLLALDRYPYGCAEQTTSRALPLLYLNEVAADAGHATDAATRRAHPGGHLARAYQAVVDGGFGLWGPFSGDLWLDAYVTDFLTRARETGLRGTRRRP